MLRCPVEDDRVDQLTAPRSRSKRIRLNCAVSHHSLAGVRPTSGWRWLLMCAAVIAAPWTTSCRYDYELLEQLPDGISSVTNGSSGGVAGDSTLSVGSTSA